jgi:hypothetical protein
VPASHGVRRLLPPVGARWGKLEALAPNLNFGGDADAGE